MAKRKWTRSISVDTDIPNSAQRCAEFPVNFAPDGPKKANKLTSSPRAERAQRREKIRQHCFAQNEAGKALCMRRENNLQETRCLEPEKLLQETEIASYESTRPQEGAQWRLERGAQTQRQANDNNDKALTGLQQAKDQGSQHLKAARLQLKAEAQEMLEHMFRQDASTECHRSKRLKKSAEKQDTSEISKRYKEGGRLLQQVDDQDELECVRRKEAAGLQQHAQRQESLDSDRPIFEPGKERNGQADWTHTPPPQYPVDTYGTKGPRHDEQSFRNNNNNNNQDDRILYAHCEETNPPPTPDPSQTVQKHESHPSERPHTLSLDPPRLSCPPPSDPVSSTRIFQDPITDSNPSSSYDEESGQDMVWYESSCSSASSPIELHGKASVSVVDAMDERGADCVRAELERAEDEGGGVDMVDGRGGEVGGGDARRRVLVRSAGAVVGLVAVGVLASRQQGVEGWERVVKAVMRKDDF